MTRASSGLAYPDRFYAAAAYAGFGGSPTSSSKAAISKFQNDVALLLYGLHQQVTDSNLTDPISNSRIFCRFGLFLVDFCSDLDFRCFFVEIELDLGFLDGNVGQKIVDRGSGEWRV